MVIEEDLTFGVHVWGRDAPKLELSFGWWAPNSTGFPHWVSVLGTHLYQCTSWRCCERLHSASVNFFWRSCQCVCPFHEGWFTSAPAHTSLSAQQFWPKTAWPPCPTLPVHMFSPWVTFFCLSRRKKSTMGNILLMWKSWNKQTKNGRHPKSHQNQQIQNLFWEWKKILIGVLHQMESTL